MSNKELKPCPFCGGEATLTSSGADDGDNVVECTKCNYELGYYANPKMAINAWNRRVDVALTRSDIEKMVKLKWRDNRPMVADCGDFNLNIFYMRENEYTIYASKGILGGEMYIGTTKSEDEAKQKAKAWVVDIICSALGVEE